MVGLHSQSYVAINGCRVTSSILVMCPIQATTTKYVFMKSIIFCCLNTETVRMLSLRDNSNSLGVHIIVSHQLYVFRGVRLY